MQVQKRPFEIDFIDNAPRYELRVNPNILAGRCASKTFIVEYLPDLYFLYFNTPNVKLKFHIEEQETDNPNVIKHVQPFTENIAEEIQKAFNSRFIHNAEINEFYTVEDYILNNQYYIKITAKNEGNQNINLFVDLGTTGNPPIYPVVSKSGATSIIKPNLKVVSKFQIFRNNDKITTPAFFNDHFKGTVSIGCDILKPYFLPPAIPPRNNTIMTPIKQNNAIIKTNIIYAERYEIDNENKTQVVTVDYKDIYLINGKLNDYEQKNNIPDWKVTNKRHFYLSNDIDIFSQDNNETVFADFNTEQYLYISNFSKENITALLKVDYLTESNETGTKEFSITFDAMAIYQIPVAPASLFLNADDLLFYSVSISNNNIKRSFIRKAYEATAKTFLLLNAMNLYETFTVDYIAEEQQTETERYIFNDIDVHYTTSTQTIYTAKCNPRNPKTLQLLKTAIYKQNNLLLDGAFVWELDFLPSTLKIKDDTTQLLEVEFQFRKRKKINRAFQQLPILTAKDNVLRTDTFIK